MNREEYKGHSYMKTVSGTRVYLDDPRPEQILLDDIANGLAYYCRWGAQVKEFFSVAEHSVRASYICDPEDAINALFHDASEAFIGDLIRPVKYIPEIYAVYKPLEKRIGAAIAKKFGFETIEKTPSVQMADDIMLISECIAFRPEDSGDWYKEILAKYPGKEPIVLKKPWNPKKAKQKFLHRYYELLKNATSQEK